MHTHASTVIFVHHPRVTYLRLALHHLSSLPSLDALTPSPSLTLPPPRPAPSLSVYHSLIDAFRYRNIEHNIVILHYKYYIKSRSLRKVSEIDRSEKKRDEAGGGRREERRVRTTKTGEGGSEQRVSPWRSSSRKRRSRRRKPPCPRRRARRRRCGPVFVPVCARVCVRVRVRVCGVAPSRWSWLSRSGTLSAGVLCVSKGNEPRAKGELLSTVRCASAADDDADEWDSAGTRKWRRRLTCNP